MTVFLLDTCATVWIANGDRLREPAASALRNAHGPDARLAVSPMTAWEIAMLAAKGKIALAIGPDVWFERFRALPGVTLAELPILVLIAAAALPGSPPADPVDRILAAAALPGSPPADPVDRILAATARAFGYTLVTRDRHLLAYGAIGHARVMAC